MVKNPEKPDEGVCIGLPPQMLVISLPQGQVIESMNPAVPKQRGACSLFQERLVVLTH